MQAYANLPDMLKNLPRWVCYRKITLANGSKKIPINPANGKFARVDDTETWAGFEDAIEKAPAYDGIGFMLGDGIMGIDLDHVIENGILSDEAKDIVGIMNTYTEISPSGTGIHMIAIGRLPEGERRKGSVEMYDQRRFFTVTGNVLDSNRVYPFEDRTSQAAMVHLKYLAAEKKAPAPAAPSMSKPLQSDSIEGIIRIASNAQNGDHFKRLFNGDLTDYTSPSEADLALCNMAAFYAGGRADLIDGVFRASALMRPKWDQKRGAKTYGEKTIKKAIDGTQLPVRQMRTRSNQSTIMPSAPILPASAANLPALQIEGLCSVIDASDGQHERMPAITTGLTKLDHHLNGGLHAGLYVLGAEATIGKTTLALQLTRTAAGQGSPVLFVSYEQPADQLRKKLFNGLRRGNTNLPIMPAEAQLLSRILVPNRDADLSTASLLDLLERFLRCCAMQQPDRLPLIVVDYLQAAAMQETNARAAIDALVAGLRRLVRQFDACILTISSLNRSAYLQPVHRDSFKESGGIEYAADVILGLHLSIMNSRDYLSLRDDRAAQATLADDALARTPRLLTLSILKNRDGAIPSPISLTYDPSADHMQE